MRVLDWIVDRCEGKVDAQETAIGYLPYAKDINLDGLDMTEEQLDKILDFQLCNVGGNAVGYIYGFTANDKLAHVWLCGFYCTDRKTSKKPKRCF